MLKFQKVLKVLIVLGLVLAALGCEIVTGKPGYLGVKASSSSSASAVSVSSSGEKEIKDITETGEVIKKIQVPKINEEKKRKDSKVKSKKDSKKNNKEMKPLIITYYEQEKDHHSGPACLRMIKKYMVHTITQKTIINKCGTTEKGTGIHMMAAYLNSSDKAKSTSKMPEWWLWEVEKIKDKVDFKDKMMWTIGDAKVPQIWAVNTVVDEKTKLAGHTSSKKQYILGLGYNFDISKHQVTYHDPSQKDAGENVNADFDLVYKCIEENNNGKQIIY